MAVTTTAAIVIASVAALASAGIGSYTAVAQANAAEEANKFNAAVARNNAAAAQAESTQEAGRQRDRTRRLIASQRASFAKSGGALSGSALDVIGDTAIQGELDALSIQYRGAVAANQQRNQESAYRRAARTAQQGVALGVGGSILGAASSGVSLYAGLPRVR